MAKSLQCLSSYSKVDFCTGKSKKAQNQEESMLKKIEADPKQPQNISKVAFGDHPQNFYGAPIQLIEEPPKPGLFEPLIARDILDEELKRLKVKGLNSREISGELAKQGTMITWQRVRRRFAIMARRKSKEVPQSPVTKPKSPEPQRSNPALMPAAPKQAESLGLSSDMAERIIMLSIQKLSPHSISDALEEECGAILSESQIMDIIVRKARGEI
jgi:hypothetical protein